MKKKELIQLIAGVVILAVAGYFVYLQLAPKNSAKKELSYEKITPIETEFSQQSLQRLSDVSIAKDFYAPPDLNSGVGNTLPFNQLR